MLGIDSTAARRAWSALFVLLILAGLFLIRQTLLVFIVALMFSYLLFPIVEFNHRYLSKSRTVAALFPFFIFLASVALAGFIVHPQFNRERDQLISQITSPQFAQRLEAWSLADVPVGRLLTNNYGSILSMLPKRTLSSGLHTTLQDVGDLVLIPIVSFFFLRDGRRIRDTIIALLFGSNESTAFFRKGRTVAISLLTDAHALILDYMRTLLFQCVATFVAYSIALTLLGVPYAVLLALVAFPLEFVPLVGPLASAIVILAVCEFDLTMNPESVPHLHIVAVIAFLICYRIFQDYILSPALMRRGVKLHPLMIIFGVYAGAEIGGVSGVFLSVPLIALGRLVFYEWRKPVPPLASDILPVSPETSAELDAVT